MASIAEGQKAPDISLPTEPDGRFNLSDHLGQKVVVFFYPKDDTSGCTAEAKDFSDALGALNDADAVVVGISPDPIKKHAKFRDKHDLTVTLASDEERSVLEAYGVWVEKSMYGRKYMGVDRTTVLIDRKGNVAKLWEKVKVPGHVDAVLAAVQSLES